MSYTSHVSSHNQPSGKDVIFSKCPHHLFTFGWNLLSTPFIRSPGYQFPTDIFSPSQRSPDHLPGKTWRRIALFALSDIWNKVSGTGWSPPPPPISCVAFPLLGLQGPRDPPSRVEGEVTLVKPIIITIMFRLSSQLLPSNAIGW